MTAILRKGNKKNEKNRERLFIHHREKVKIPFQTLSVSTLRANYFHNLSVDNCNIVAKKISEGCAVAAI